MYDEKTRSNENLLGEQKNFFIVFSSIFIVFLLFGRSLVVFYGSNGWLSIQNSNVFLSCRKNSAFYLDKYTFGLLLLTVSTRRSSQTPIQSNNTEYSNSISCKQTCQILQLRNDVRAQDLNEIVNFSNWETRLKTPNDNHTPLHTYLSLLMKTFRTHYCFDGKSGFSQCEKQMLKIAFSILASHFISIHRSENETRCQPVSPSSPLLLSLSLSS